MRQPISSRFSYDLWLQLCRDILAGNAPAPAMPPSFPRRGRAK